MLAEDIRILIDDCTDYLALSDDDLRGYGLTRSNLEYRLGVLQAELNALEPCACDLCA